MSTSQTTYSCRKPARATGATGCIRIILVIVQPYAFTFTIIQQQNPTVCRAATNLSAPESGF